MANDRANTGFVAATHREAQWHWHQRGEPARARQVHLSLPARLSAMLCLWMRERGQQRERAVYEETEEAQSCDARSTMGLPPSASVKTMAYKVQNNGSREDVEVVPAGVTLIQARACNVHQQCRGIARRAIRLARVACQALTATQTATVVHAHVHTHTHGTSTRPNRSFSAAQLRARAERL